MIIVARVQPGTSKGITDLLLPHPSSGLNSFAAVPIVTLPINQKLIEKIKNTYIAIYILNFFIKICLLFNFSKKNFKKIK